jgi:ATP-dependent protease HslVU (ClpYQ) peptidase subunit
MAADGLCTGNNTVHGTKTKKLFRLKDGRICGMSGNSYVTSSFVAWLENGGDRPEIDDNFEALVLHHDGSVIAYNGKCQSMEQETPAVSGSGGTLALGAMLAGASPAQAVAIAALRDISCGGDIMVEALP